MRLRHNSTSPHSSLSPSRSAGGGGGAKTRSSAPTMRVARRTSETGEATPRSSAAAGPRRSTQRAESSSPRAVERAGLRTRSRTGRGLLDRSGFLSEEEEPPAATNGAAANGEADGDDEPRRSSRNRTLKYSSLDPEYLTNDDVIRHRSEVEKGAASPVKNGGAKGHEDEDDDEDDDDFSAGEAADEEESVSEEEEEEDDDEEERTPPRMGKRPDARGESPFYAGRHHGHHVQFSPSAKPGSPAMRRTLRHRQQVVVGAARPSARVVRQTRLHNLPSEEEESEFERRYSRDLRSRKRKEGGGGEAKDAEPAVRRSSRGAAPKEEEEEETDGDKSVGDMEVDGEGDAEAAGGLRRSKRIHKPIQPHPGDDEEEAEETSEDEEEEVGEDEVIKRECRRQLPRRNRVPVVRLNYEPSPRLVAPRGSGGGGRADELRNLDQYSSDEEYEAAGGGGVGGARSRRSRYNMRENRRTITRYGAAAALDVGGKPSAVGKGGRRDYGRTRGDRTARRLKSYKDSSSSSASSGGDATDEERFQRRKRKRMNLERSKMLPVNFRKEDANRAVFRDRQKSGTSLADVSPMEIDLNIKFDDVGGCAQQVNSLKEMVVLPMVYPELFKKFDITPPRGVLFYGPPGTGKTLMARALASECSREGRKVAFFMRKGADCLSKWIGESERQLRLLFDQAFLMRPSVIFFDEIDGLAPVRSSRQDQIHSSIVSTLLALMDGLDGRGEVVVVGATNRIENIDPALRRPGRFDRELRFGLPTRDARREILGLHTRSWRPPLDDEARDRLADATVGYCGADLKGLCAEAGLSALRRRYPQVYKSSQRLAIDLDRVQVREDDFRAAMRAIVPSGQRVQDQSQSPLPKAVRPLLQPAADKICRTLDAAMRVDGHQKEDPFGGAALCFRPRLLLRAAAGAGQGLTTYLAPAALHHLERFPCHRLDLPALFSNSTRTPEEAVCQIVHEAKRTAPSCIYIPHLDRLWQVLTTTCRETLITLLGDIPPTMPLLLLATHEGETDDDDESGVGELFRPEMGQVFAVEPPSAADRREFFSQVAVAAAAPVPEPEADPDEVLDVAPAVSNRELTERESKRLRKREERIQRELRIFLREVWGKINREQKFFMFRSAVDTEEVDDYMELIKVPMDFDKMLSKLDNREYKCAQDFLSDIDLIAENAITYNSDMSYETNKIICHRARALQDFSYALVKAEMDTDFEDECRDIKERRQKLERELSDQPVTVTDGGEAGAKSDGEPQRETPSARRRPRKRVSSWARGECRKRVRRSHHEDEEEDEGEEDEEANGEDDGASSTGKASSGGGHSAETAGQTQSSSPRSSGRRRAAVNGGPSPPSPAKANAATPESAAPTAAVRVDQARLAQFVREAARLTEGFGVERLERLLVSLLGVAAGYRDRADRAQLPAELTRCLEAAVGNKAASSAAAHHR